ncbi:hypothetical protein D3C73_1129450 [compost metagenome]
MHHQRRVGRHQVDELSGKCCTQVFAGGEHPRHVAFGDFVEQAHHQAIQCHHFDAQLHDVPS